MTKTTLTITNLGDVYECDDKNISGSPPVGLGKTINEAIGDWLRNNQERMGIQFNTDAVQDIVDADIKAQLAQR